MHTLTKRQKEVLDYIEQYNRERGYAPSLEDMRKHFGLASPSTAHYYVERLRKDGYIKKVRRHPRSISVRGGDFETLKRRLDPEQLDSISLPVLGSANAGTASIFAEGNIEGYLKISRSMLNKRKGVFVLRASGNSMNKAKIRGKGINDGDFVLIDSTDRDPKDGDYVLSVIDNCANLKRFRVDKKSRQKVLVSESTETHMPIFLHEDDDFMINGKIIAVVKK